MGVSLIGKWLPSLNASSSETKRLAKIIQKDLGLTPKQYRKMLTKLRSEINILEQNMSQKTWDNVDYAKIPSQAMLRYKQAFYRNDIEKYTAYLDSLSKGHTKINAGALYPYQLVQKASSTWNMSQEERVLLDQMWKALPDRVTNTDNSIAVVDVSGSMIGTPMDVAVALGMYIAERNTGAYHNHFITFSERPQLVEIIGSDFVDRVNNIRRADWGMSTNLEAVFNLILKTAIDNNVSQEELPTTLYIISDMQFNAATRRSPDNQTFFNTMKQKFEQQGYKLPKVVFWNVRGDYNQSPVTKDTENAQLVSGFSQNLFKAIMESTAYNPYDLMMDALNSERYAPITYSA